MKRIFAVFAILSAALLSACKTGYDLVQDNAREKCDRLITDMDRAACRNNNRDSYDTYKKKREEVINNQKSS